MNYKKVDLLWKISKEISKVGYYIHTEIYTLKFSFPNWCKPIKCRDLRKVIRPIRSLKNTKVISLQFLIREKNMSQLWRTRTRKRKQSGARSNLVCWTNFWQAKTWRVRVLFNSIGRTGSVSCSLFVGQFEVSQQNERKAGRETNISLKLLWRWLSKTSKCSLNEANFMEYSRLNWFILFSLAKQLSQYVGHGFSISVCRSWVRFPFKPEFFPGLLFPQPA